jgi:predicted membrane protein
MLGGVLVLAGSAVLLSHLGLLGDFEVWNLWPLMLVLAGILKLSGREEIHGRAWGLILLTVGAVIQLHYFGMISLQWNLVWPALLIVLGIYVITSSMYRSRLRKGKSLSAGVLDAFVVLGGMDDQVDSQEFEGGDIFCFMGAYDLDLRNAQMKGSEAVLNIKIVMGGVDVRIPDNWRATVRGTPVMGAFENKIRAGKGDDESQKKHLIIEGLVLMGGVDIRN